MNHANLKKQRQSRTFHRQQDIKSSAFLNRAIKYLGENKAGLESNAEKVGDRVESFVKKFLDELETRDSLFKGIVHPCGSYYEGVKVKEPNEFDYIYELTSSVLENLEPEHEVPKTFKPYKTQDIKGRSYYKLTFKPTIPALWKPYAREHQELDPRKMQGRFKELVQTIAREMPDRVQCNGPAVTLYGKLKHEAVEEHLNKKGVKRLNQMGGKNYEGFLIKIDISLAIPVRTVQGNRWPLQGRGGAELNFDMLEPDVIGECHPVPSGNFWRVSFSTLETEMMRKYAESVDKKGLFQALKVNITSFCPCHM